MTDLSKKTKLAPRNAPYWQRLAACKFVGVRVGSRGRVWMAKYDADERHQKRLAAVDYEAAVQEAWAWFKTIDQGVLGAHAETVEDALVVHWKYLDRVKAGAGSNRYRLQKHLPARILRMPIDRLSEKMIRDWHESMIVEGAGDDKKRTSMDSANRTLSALKAALNRATKGRSILKAAWQEVEPFKAVGSARKTFLSAAHVERLLNAADPDLRLLLAAAWATGARPGELWEARCRDFDGDTWHVSKSKTGPRDVMLTRHGVELFASVTAGRDPDDLIFMRADGASWDKDRIRRSMKHAVRRGKVDPKTVMYTLRHSFISAAIKANINLKAIADQVGTSIMMIEKHYGKILNEDRRQLFEAAGFDLGPVATNVVDLDKARG